MLNAMIYRMKTEWSVKYIEEKAVDIDSAVARENQEFKKNGENKKHQISIKY